MYYNRFKQMLAHSLEKYINLNLGIWGCGWKLTLKLEGSGSKIGTLRNPDEPLELVDIIHVNVSLLY